MSPWTLCGCVFCSPLTFTLISADRCVLPDARRQSSSLPQFVCLCRRDSSGRCSIQLVLRSSQQGRHVMKVRCKNVFSAPTLKCLFVSRSEESAVQTDGRRPAQHQVETRTTAPRVVRHLTVMTKHQTCVCFTVNVSRMKRRQHPAGAPSP